LFTNAQPTDVAMPAPAPLGVPDSSGLGFDVLDVGLKLIAVLGLAYGSLLLLKRTGMGGATTMKPGGKSAGMQVVSSLTLAPNRTVHLLKVPGGKTVLVGATPNQVNLIVDLGEIPEDLESDTAASFFDILKSKISQ
jgi:flagellar biogenesis protein FliO